MIQVVFLKSTGVLRVHRLVVYPTYCPRVRHDSESSIEDTEEGGLHFFKRVPRM